MLKDSLTLFIDTTDFKKAKLTLSEANKILVEKEFLSGRYLSEKLLFEIEKLFSSCKRNLSQLMHVHVNPGPGSFTGTRIGVAVANGIGFALGIPVNNLPYGKYVEPVYEANGLHVGKMRKET